MWRARLLVWTSAIALAVGLAASDAAAQYRARGAVEVDWSVLDELGGSRIGLRRPPAPGEFQEFTPRDSARQSVSGTRRSIRTASPVATRRGRSNVASADPARSMERLARALELQSQEIARLREQLAAMPPPTTTGAAPSRERAPSGLAAAPRAAPERVRRPRAERPSELAELPRLPDRAPPSRRGSAQSFDYLRDAPPVPVTQLPSGAPIPPPPLPGQPSLPSVAPPMQLTRPAPPLPSSSALAPPLVSPPASGLSAPSLSPSVVVAPPPVSPPASGLPLPIPQPAQPTLPAIAPQLAGVRPAPTPPAPTGVVPPAPQIAGRAPFATPSVGAAIPAPPPREAQPPPIQINPNLPPSPAGTRTPLAVPPSGLALSPSVTVGPLPAPGARGVGVAEAPTPPLSVRDTRATGQLLAPPPQATLPPPLVRPPSVAQAPALPTARPSDTQLTPPRAAPSGAARSPGINIIEGADLDGRGRGDLTAMPARRGFGEFERGARGGREPVGARAAPGSVARAPTPSIIANPEDDPGETAESARLTNDRRGRALPPSMAAVPPPAVAPRLLPALPTVPPQAALTAPPVRTPAPLPPQPSVQVAPLPQVTAPAPTVRAPAFQPSLPSVAQVAPPAVTPPPQVTAPAPSVRALAPLPTLPSVAQAPASRAAAPAPQPTIAPPVVRPAPSIAQAVPPTQAPAPRVLAPAPSVPAVVQAPAVQQAAVPPPIVRAPPAPSVSAAPAPRVAAPAPAVPEVRAEPAPPPIRPAPPPQAQSSSGPQTWGNVQVVQAPGVEVRPLPPNARQPVATAPVDQSRRVRVERGVGSGTPQVVAGAPSAAPRTVPADTPTFVVGTDGRVAPAPAARDGAAARRAPTRDTPIYEVAPPILPTQAPAVAQAPAEASRTALPPVVAPAPRLPTATAPARQPAAATPAPARVTPVEPGETIRPVVARNDGREAPRAPSPTLPIPRAVSSAEAATLPARQPEPGALRPAMPVAPVTAPQPAAAPAVAAVQPQRTQSSALGRVEFAADSVDIPASARAVLDRAAAEMQRDPDARLRLTAVSTASDSSAARRISLSRALAVRAYLIERGVRATRMDLQALAGSAGEGAAPGNRVDVAVVAR